MTPFDAVVAEWQDGQPASCTSGSTGQPTTHRFHPDAVRASARATAAHFGLQGNNIRTWSALPAAGTGGRMAVWRALILGWDLTVSSPSSAPVVPPYGSDRDGRYDFGVATPMQARHLLTSGQLGRFHQLLLGGAPLDPKLETALIEAGTSQHCQIHLGFGMTETLTHIATRPLGKKAFHPLPGITLRIREDQRLEIDAPDRGVQQLLTQDAAEWADSTDSMRFHWLGRCDDVMNTGGIKVYPGAVEGQLGPHIDPLIGHRRWYITGREDTVLGNRITLVVEGPRDEELARSILAAGGSLGNVRPRAVEFMPVFESTATGKLLRK